jgi:hypothetical protein
MRWLRDLPVFPPFIARERGEMHGAGHFSRIPLRRCTGPDQTSRFGEIQRARRR